MTTSVAFFKRLTAAGYTPRGSTHDYPILPVNAFTVNNLYTTADDLTGLPDSIKFDIRRAEASGQEQTEIPGSPAKLLPIAIIGVQVTDFYVLGMEVEFKRDGDSVLRFSSTAVEATDDPNDPIRGTVKPVRTFEPLIIYRLQSGATYDFRVRVLDTLGNRSDWSGSISYNAGNTTAPTAPTCEIVHDYTQFQDELY